MQPVQGREIALEVSADFLQRALAPFSLWAGEIAIEASSEGVARRIVSGFLLERGIGAERDFGSKDLRCRPRPFDVCLLKVTRRLVPFNLYW